MSRGDRPPCLSGRAEHAPRRAPRAGSHGGLPPRQHRRPSPHGWTSRTRRRIAEAMSTAAGLPIAKGKQLIELVPRMANRHGLIAGATGTGKTTSLRVLAEQFSSIGVPVFLADVKGDCSGFAKPGGDNPKVRERAKQLGVDLVPAACPVVFWDLFGEQGHPVRATVSEMGPLLLGRLLGLNDTQSGVLSIVFKVADDGGLLLLDLKDLRAMLEDVGKHAAELKVKYGNVS